MSVAQLDVEALQADALLTTKPEPLLITYWNRLRKHRLAIASLITLGLIILFVTLGPVILSRMTYYNVSQDAVVNYTRDGQDLANRNASPSLEHPMGTDELGRDVLYRLMEAGRLVALRGLYCCLYVGNVWDVPGSAFRLLWRVV